MMAGNPSWWSMNNGMHPQQTHQLNIPNNSSTGFGNNQYTSSTPPLPPQYHFYGGSPPLVDHHHHHHHPDQQQDFPRSWSQLLLGGGLANSNNNNNSSDQRFVSPFESKKLGNWEDHVKQDAGMGQNNNLILYGESADELIQVSRPAPWSQIVPTSSPTSCVTSLSSNLLNFSANSKHEKRSQHQENSSECHSSTTCNVHKKPRIQNSSPQPALKVRKEKLGDRITALHQLVSPFGKTDTASVLSEAIGYIRFLQAQIEALSSPYLGNVAGGNMGQPHQHSDVEDRAKDLRTRGLCLVPVSCTQHVGNDTGADYWAPALGGGF